MIRPLTCLCLLMAAGSGLYLYQTKHRTLMLDRQIGDVLQQADAARARSTLLRAEYALLNQPDRLAALSGRYLQLRPLAPTQFVQLASLAAHLPPVQAFPPPGTPDVPVPAASPVVSAIASAAATTDTDADATADGPADPRAGSGATGTAPSQPVAMAANEAAPHDAGDAGTHAADPAPHPTQAAVRKPAHHTAPFPANHAAPFPANNTAPSPEAHPIVTASVRSAPEPGPARRYGSGDNGGSMLGGDAGELAPPVPVAN